jgi:hypothetical protein
MNFRQSHLFDLFIVTIMIPIPSVLGVTPATREVTKGSPYKNGWYACIYSLTL